MTSETELRVKGAAEMYADAADQLGGWLNELNKTIGVLLERFPSRGYAAEDQRVAAEQALRRLADVAAAMRAADRACGAASATLGRDVL
jgi:hypothetical protein